MTIKDMDLDQPFPSIFPEEWNNEIGPRDFMMFRNLDHFKYAVSNISQKDDMKCGMSYKEALRKMVAGESDFPKSEQASIRNLVRSNLLKRGLITQEVYEAFQYSVDGTNVGVDVGKYAAGEPDCVITPSRQYVDFFYELYVSISYAWNVTNEDVRRNTAKLLATIEELERKHIFIKITLVFPANHVVNRDERTSYFGSIPVFSHKDFKSVETMSAVLNDRLLRKFFFAIFEELYGDKLRSSYGTVVDLSRTMNIGEEFNETKFFEEVMCAVGFEE